MTLTDLDDAIRTLRPACVRWAARLDLDAAEDIAQEALLALARRREDVPRDAASAWLYEAVRRIGADHRRRVARRREDPTAAPDVASPQPDPEDTLVSAQLSTAVQEALARVPASRREVLVEVVAEGASPTELGREQGVAPSTLRTRALADAEAVREELHRQRVAEKRRTGGHASWALLPFMDVRAGRKALALLGATAAVVAAGGARLHIPPLNPTPEERPAPILALDTVRPITPLPAAVRAEGQPVSNAYKFAPRARHDAARHFVAVRFGR